MTQCLSAELGVGVKFEGKDFMIGSYLGMPEGAHMGLESQSGSIP